MAHKSRGEACQLHMKAVRAARAKKRFDAKIKEAEMSEEEKQELKEKQNFKTLDEKLSLMKWDYSKQQLSIYKYPEFRKLLQEKLKETNKFSKEYDELKSLLTEV